MRWPDQSERNREIVAMRESGTTYAEIAKRYDLTASRISDICIEEMQRRKRALHYHEMQEWARELKAELVRNETWRNLRTIAFQLSRLKLEPDETKWELTITAKETRVRFPI